MKAQPRKTTAATMHADNADIDVDVNVNSDVGQKRKLQENAKSSVQTETSKKQYSSSPISSSCSSSCSSSSSPSSKEENVCNACSFEISYVPVNDRLQCERCRAVWYCSVHCLQWDWKSGGHAAVCVEARPCDSSNGSMDSSVSGSGNSSGSIHEQQLQQQWGVDRAPVLEATNPEHHFDSSYTESMRSLDSRTSHAERFLRTMTEEQEEHGPILQSRSSLDPLVDVRSSTNSGKQNIDGDKPPPVLCSIMKQDSWKATPVDDISEEKVRSVKSIWENELSQSSTSSTLSPQSTAGRKGIVADSSVTSVSSNGSIQKLKNIWETKTHTKSSLATSPKHHHNTYNNSSSPQPTCEDQKGEEKSLRLYQQTNANAFASASTFVRNRVYDDDSISNSSSSNYVAPPSLAAAKQQWLEATTAINTKMKGNQSTPSCFYDFTAKRVEDDNRGNDNGMYTAEEESMTEETISENDGDEYQEVYTAEEEEEIIIIEEESWEDEEDVVLLSDSESTMEEDEGTCEDGNNQNARNHNNGLLNDLLSIQEEDISSCSTAPLEGSWRSRDDISLFSSGSLTIFSASKNTRGALNNFAKSKHDKKNVLQDYFSRGDSSATTSSLDTQGTISQSTGEQHQRQKQNGKDDEKDDEEEDTRMASATMSAAGASTETNFKRNRSIATSPRDVPTIPQEGGFGNEAMAKAMSTAALWESMNSSESTNLTGPTQEKTAIDSEGKRSSAYVKDFRNLYQGKGSYGKVMGTSTTTVSQDSTDCSETTDITGPIQSATATDYGGMGSTPLLKTKCSHYQGVPAFQDNKDFSESTTMTGPIHQVISASASIVTDGGSLLTGPKQPVLSQPVNEYKNLKKENSDKNMAASSSPATTTASTATPSTATPSTPVSPSLSLKAFRDLYRHDDNRRRSATDSGRRRSIKSLKDFRFVYQEKQQDTPDSSISTRITGPKPIPGGVRTQESQEPLLDVPPTDTRRDDSSLPRENSENSGSTNKTNRSSREFKAKRRLSLEEHLGNVDRLTDDELRATMVQQMKAKELYENAAAHSSAIPPTPSDALKTSINKALRDYEKIYGEGAARAAVLQLTNGIATNNAAVANETENESAKKGDHTEGNCTEDDDIISESLKSEQLQKNAASPRSSKDQVPEGRDKETTNTLIGNDNDIARVTRQLSPSSLGPCTVSSWGLADLSVDVASTRCSNESASKNEGDGEEGGSTLLSSRSLDSNGSSKEKPAPVDSNVAEKLRASQSHAPQRLVHSNIITADASVTSKQLLESPSNPFASAQATPIASNVTSALLGKVGPELLAAGCSTPCDGTDFDEILVATISTSLVASESPVALTTSVAATSATQTTTTTAFVSCQTPFDTSARNSHASLSSGRVYEDEDALAWAERLAATVPAVRTPFDISIHEDKNSCNSETSTSSPYKVEIRSTPIDQTASDLFDAPKPRNMRCRESLVNRASNKLSLKEPRTFQRKKQGNEKDEDTARYPQTIASVVTSSSACAGTRYGVEEFESNYGEGDSSQSSREEGSVADDIQERLSLYLAKNQFGSSNRPARHARLYLRSGLTQSDLESSWSGIGSPKLPAGLLEAFPPNDVKGVPQGDKEHTTTSEDCFEVPKSAYQKRNRSNDGTNGHAVDDYHTKSGREQNQSISTCCTIQ